MNPHTKLSQVNRNISSVNSGPRQTFVFCSCLYSGKWEKKKCNNQSNERHNQGQFRSGEVAEKPAKWSGVSPALCSRELSGHACCDLGIRMSYKVNYSPLLCAHTPPPPRPCHKVCDVAYSPGMKGQTLLGETDSAVLCGSGPPDDGVPPLKADQWPDGAEETSGMERLLRKCQIRNQLVRECLAECLGVYVLIVSIFLWGSELNLAAQGNLL